MTHQHFILETILGYIQQNYSGVDNVKINQKMVRSKFDQEGDWYKVCT